MIISNFLEKNKTKIDNAKRIQAQGEDYKTVPDIAKQKYVGPAGGESTMARTYDPFAMLARKADELELGEDNKNGIGEFTFQDADTSKLNEFQKYMRANYYDVNEDLYAGRALNWDADLSWNTEDYYDQAYAEVMDSLYLPPELWYNGEIKLDVSKLVYSYTWFDAEGAAAESKRTRQQFIDRAPFIKKEKGNSTQ